MNFNKGDKVVVNMNNPKHMEYLSRMFDGFTKDTSLTVGDIALEADGSAQRIIYVYREEDPERQIMCFDKRLLPYRSYNTFNEELFTL
jgi:hypothetical protein